MERLGESCFVSEKGGSSELVREGSWQPGHGDYIHIVTGFTRVLFLKFLKD